MAGKDRRRGGSGMGGKVLFVDPGATWREVLTVIAGHVATGGGSGGHVAERKFRGVAVYVVIGGVVVLVVVGGGSAGRQHGRQGR